MTRSYVHRCYRVPNCLFEHYRTNRKGRVYRKNQCPLYKEHRGVNNTKLLHSQLLDAVCDPRGDHSYNVYGIDYSIWIY